MIKYLGSKRLLVPHIAGVVRALGPGVRSVIDLFSGTSRVGHALKRDGYRVLANDHNAYAHALATCYVQADRERRAEDAARLIDELNALPGEPGYFTRTFCEESRFFRPEAGARIDAVRARIAALALGPELEAVLLTALLEAADRVDSTAGLQMAYLKGWAPRTTRPLTLRLPELLPRSPHGPGEAHMLDALDAAALLEADAAYLDPPYNQHSYLGNYHVWETLVRWDAPEPYGVARKRADVRERRSPFNARATCLPALAAVVERVRARHLIVSFSDEGFVALDNLRALLRRRVPGGHVLTLAFDSPRYVGARIGIYNPRGEKVGKVGRLRNVEHLLVATPDEPSPALLALADAFHPARLPPREPPTPGPAENPAAAHETPLQPAPEDPVIVAASPRIP